MGAVLVWFMTGAPEPAAEAPGPVKALLDSGMGAAEARCSYTRTRVDGAESKTERYHAGDPDTPWVLEQVNGREPTAAQLRRYARGAGDRDRRHPLAFELGGMVSPDHWRLLAETETQAVYQFRLRPNAGLDAHLAEKVLGTLVVDKDRHQPVRVTIENTEPVYVAPLVRVAHYLQELRFRWDERVGAAVLTEAETHWRGRAVGLKRLNRHKLVRYADYQCDADVAG